MNFITFIIYASIYIGLIATSFYIITYISGRKKEILFKDNELPKVSVLIPVYNEEKTIEKTLKSILNTDYSKKKLEIIVINDGSTDKTLEIANKYRKKGIKIYSKKNGGKASALNLGIKKCKNDFIFTMDADSIADPISLKNMVRYFKNKEVMCVSPAIVTLPPGNILHRIQRIEYLLGIFLRRTFALLNAIHITPGAFSAYRKSFFEKYGGYDENNITEDLEMAMKIQYYGYKIENSPESPVYTDPPKTFMHLLKQRRRWYVGLMKNMLKYRKLLSRDYGDLGIFVLPIAWISISFAVFITYYFFIKTLINITDELSFLNSINFDFSNLFNLNFYFIERFFFLLITNPIIIFILFFIIITGFYIYYASKKLGRLSGLIIDIPLFFIFFSILFGFWWIVSVFYVVFNKKVSWK